MATNRWDVGPCDAGQDFTDEFASPLTVRKFSDYATLQTVVADPIPATMAEQMDGDQNVNWTAGGGRRRRR